MGWLCINCTYSDSASRSSCCSTRCTRTWTPDRRSVDSSNEAGWREKEAGKKRRLSEHRRSGEGQRRNRNGENWLKGSKSDTSEETYKDGEYTRWRRKKEEGRRKEGCSTGEKERIERRKSGDNRHHKTDKSLQKTEKSLQKTENCLKKTEKSLRKVTKQVSPEEMLRDIEDGENIEEILLVKAFPDMDEYFGKFGSVVKISKLAHSEDIYKILFVSSTSVIKVLKHEHKKQKIEFHQLAEVATRRMERHSRSVKSGHSHTEERRERNISGHNKIDKLEEEEIEEGEIVTSPKKMKISENEMFLKNSLMRSKVSWLCSYTIL